jgi:NAD(P)-dependent dehydrogenase (short-subunit alcohol dehydrogenase family)
MRFSQGILECFAAASRDYSPLHMSDSYARTTPFGQRVVHGACAVLACCGSLTPPPDCFPSAVRVVFYQPLFPDLDYELHVSEISPQRARVSIMDGSTQVVDITFDYLPGTPPVATLPGAAAAPLSLARAVNEADLTGAWATEGWYSPCGSNYLALLHALGIQRRAWGDALPIALMATSYMTGMELPGERAMYFRLEAEFPGGPVDLPSAFHQELTGYDQRWGLVKSRFRLTCGHRVWSSGEIQAFLRPSRPGIAPFAGAVGPEMAARFAGKIALAVGASRGFGSSLALTLAAAGATVVALYARSSEDAERLRQAAQGLPGQILPVQGDAADPVTCREIRQQVLALHGRLDWLVCSAVPSLQPLRVEAAAFERIDRFLRNGFALALAPLASFLDLLSESGGTVLLISSSSVEDPPAIWPHYVALKCAIEGLVRVSAAEYPKVSFCIARPTKLNTDMMNTPMGRTKAENPSAAALRILSEAVTAARPGEICYLK